MGKYIDMDMAASLVASGAASAETRQEFAAQQMRGADARGGLLGRLAGVKKGGSVYKGSSNGGNAGSAEFQAIQATYANIHQAEVDAWLAAGGRVGSGKEEW